MISRLIQHFTRGELSWDSYVEVLAALPGNH